MSETDDNKYPIPGGKLDGLGIQVGLSTFIESLPHCAGVNVDDDGDIRIYLGQLSVSMPAAQWRLIVDALNAALADAEPINLYPVAAEANA